MDVTSVLNFTSYTIVNSGCIFQTLRDLSLLPVIRVSVSTIAIAKIPPLWEVFRAFK